MDRNTQRTGHASPTGLALHHSGEEMNMYATRPSYLASYTDTQIACMSHALMMQMAEIEETPIDLATARQVRDEAETRLAA